MSPALEAEILSEVASAAEMQRPVFFPDARRFSDLFSSARVVRDFSPGKIRPRAVHHFGGAVVRSHCSAHGRRDPVLDVTPTPEVLQAIAESMLSAPYTIDFNVVLRDTGTALVTAAYNEILGDRWLGIVDASTIPGRGPRKSVHLCSVCRQEGHNARTCLIRWKAGRP